MVDQRRRESDEPALSQPSVLAQRAAAGDHDAWEAIYRAVYPRLRAYLARHAGSGVVEDLVSETMLRAVKGIGTFQPTPAGIDPWLFGIARRVVVDHHRVKERNDRRDSLAVGDEAIPAPGADVVAADEQAEIRAAFDRLADSDRELLELRIIAGLSTEEIAIALGKKEGAVRTAQSRALTRLRKIMETS